jgi:hypothetical protein
LSAEKFLFQHWKPAPLDQDSEHLRRPSFQQLDFKVQNLYIGAFAGGSAIED